MSEHDDLPDWMHDLGAELPTMEDIAAEGLREVKEVARLLGKYEHRLPRPGQCTDEELLAVMEPDDAAWWLRRRAAQDGDGGAI